MDQLADAISVTLQMIKAKGQFGPTIVGHQISSYRFSHCYVILYHHYVTL